MAWAGARHLTDVDGRFFHVYEWTARVTGRYKPEQNSRSVSTTTPAAAVRCSAVVSWSKGSSCSSEDESVTSQFCIAKLWSVYDKENEEIRDNLKLGEEKFRVIGEKRKMEEQLRFFKLDFAKMVAGKEEAISELGNARLALSDLKEEIEKKQLADHGCTNLHQVLRAKAAKERDQLVVERDQLMQEKKKLEYIVSNLIK
ncbi:putative CBL-interacting protein kinase 13 [Hordeum vulgare]|nr:putative CBL-interacting protein kinase 13 [Hordeum vulgare]